MTEIKEFVKENGAIVCKSVDNVDFKSLPSKDPIAYYFGQQDGKKNKIILKSEVKTLAKEYLRGYKEFNKLNIQ